MNSIKRVLIVGGGIGGLTAAIALKQRGIQAEIVELAKEWRVYGVGIIQPSNVLRALDSIGLAEQCVRHGGGMSGWDLCDQNGNQFGHVPNRNVAREGFPPINGITRPALHKILSEAAIEAGTPVRLGTTVASIAQSADSVEVAFTDKSTGSYDLVIGADGAYSHVRSMLFGADLCPKPSGQSVWRHNFPRRADMVNGALWFGPQSKAGLVSISDEMMYLLLVTMEPAGKRFPDETLHLALRERLRDFGGEVGALATQINDPAAVVYRPMETLLLEQPWHRGRVVLIGDAAHAGTPHLAQGAAMAIEDAIVLSEMITGAATLDDTLHTFAERRMPRCRLVYETGLQLGRWEMDEWRGAANPSADHGGLFVSALETLMEPI